MSHTLTKRQKEILDYIKISTQLNGYAPSLDEIKDHFRLSAISTVHEHVQNLKRKGFLTSENNQARSIETTDPKRSEIIIIPISEYLDEKFKVNLKRSVETLKVSKDMLTSNESLSAIEVTKDSSYFESGDLLIVMKVESAEKGELVIIGGNQDAKKLGRIEGKHKVYDFARKIERISTRIEVLAKVILLIRKY